MVQASRTAARDTCGAGGGGRSCAWCGEPIGPGKRADAVCCSKRCRQARHRFTAAVGQAEQARGVPLRIGYADPPYPGRARRYYAGHRDYAGEVDHAELVASLAAGYDAWALSTSADALQDVLGLCPAGVRVAAWVKGPRANREARSALSSWEPVIYTGARPTPTRPDPLTSPTSSVSRRDSLVHGPGPRRTDPDRVVGAKPAAFARWLFELLGAQPGDEFVDVFPGSGGITRAWEAYTRHASRHDVMDASA
ncbi:MAG: hypothetical protein ACRC35_00975 [Angustibacter sp.]